MHFIIDYVLKLTLEPFVKYSMFRNGLKEWQHVLVINTVMLDFTDHSGNVNNFKASLRQRCVIIVPRYTGYCNIFIRDTLVLYRDIISMYRYFAIFYILIRNVNRSVFSKLDKQTKIRVKNLFIC